MRILALTALTATFAFSSTAHAGIRTSKVYASYKLKPCIDIAPKDGICDSSDGTVIGGSGYYGDLTIGEDIEPFSDDFWLPVDTAFGLLWVEQAEEGHLLNVFDDHGAWLFDVTSDAPVTLLSAGISWESGAPEALFVNAEGEGLAVDIERAAAGDDLGFHE